MQFSCTSFYFIYFAPPHVVRVVDAPAHASATATTALAPLASLVAALAGPKAHAALATPAALAVPAAFAAPFDPAAPPPPPPQDRPQHFRYCKLCNFLVWPIGHDHAFRCGSGAPLPTSSTHT